MFDPVINPKGKPQLFVQNPKYGIKFKAEFMVVDENLTTSGSYKLRKLGESQCAAVYSHFFGDDQGSLSDVTHL